MIQVLLASSSGFATHHAIMQQDWGPVVGPVDLCAECSHTELLTLLC